MNINFIIYFNKITQTPPDRLAVKDFSPAADQKPVLTGILCLPTGRSRMQAVKGIPVSGCSDKTNMNNLYKEHGFTLLEMIVTLAVAAILITVGVPSMRDFALNGRMSAQSNEFISGIQLARGAAIKQQRNASICVSTTYNNSPPTCTGGTDWSAGWVVWVDQDSDNVLDATEVLRIGEPMDGNSTFTSTTRSEFRYAATGLVNGQDTLTLCDNRAGETGRQITVNAAGRVNLARLVCP